MLYFFQVQVRYPPLSILYRTFRNYLGLSAVYLKYTLAKPVLMFMIFIINIA